MKNFARYFLLFAVSISFTALSQTKDKNWLLIDSVKYEDINPANKPFLDSILTIYHKTTNDTVKLELLMILSDGIEDEPVWTRYNKLVYAMACKGGGKRVYLHYNVEEKQKEILDSIHYARRIQRSLLTSEMYIEKKLKKLIKTE